MKTVAIISEYNPFHNGHLYQIEKIREEFGQDTAIIAIMSSNFTQRGEIAIMDKWARAESAVRCGVNLVLELPFPYSMSSAEFFARAGVHIAEKTGVVDILAFGSESGDISALEDTAEKILSPALNKEIRRLSADKSTNNLGYAEIRDIAFKNVFGHEAPLNSANNILAVEYIKALRTENSSITPFTIKRTGAAYNDDTLSNGSIQSATAIRSLILQNCDSAAKFMPICVAESIFREQSVGAFPLDQESLFPAVATSFTLNFTNDADNIHDIAGGLYNRLKNKSIEATSIQSLVELATTKKYTTARIKRGIWYSLLGVTSSDVKTLPEYTQVLGMNKVGQILLKEIKKTAAISVLTRPSDLPAVPLAAKQKELADKADSISQLAKPIPMSQGSIYKRSPFVKKDV